MVRVFVTNAYAPPRHFELARGGGLIWGDPDGRFTGYLLVWDDRAMWACTMAHNLAAEIPIVGNAVRQLFFGTSQNPALHS